MEILEWETNLPEKFRLLVYFASFTLGNPESFAAEATWSCQGGNHDGGGLCVGRGRDQTLGTWLGTGWDWKRDALGGRKTGEKDLQKKKGGKKHSTHSSLGKRQQAQSGLKLEEWTRRWLEVKIIGFLTFKSNKVIFKMAWLTQAPGPFVCDLN